MTEAIGCCCVCGAAVRSADNAACGHDPRPIIPLIFDGEFGRYHMVRWNFADWIDGSEPEAKFVDAAWYGPFISGTPTSSEPPDHLIEKYGRGNLFPETLALSETQAKYLMRYPAGVPDGGEDDG